MGKPINQAAHLIVSAQSVIADLTIQYTEIQQAIDRQQTLVDSLLPVAEWGEEPAPEEPEPTEPEPEETEPEESEPSEDPEEIG